MAGSRMTGKRKCRGLLFSVLMVFFAGLWICAAEDQKPGKKPIYDPELQIERVISQSLEKARKENKHLLLMFGGNWCSWCHKLHELFHANPDVDHFLKDHYILILVDVGGKAEKPLNRDLVEKYRVKGFGYPSLAVLDPKGQLLAAQSTGILEKGNAHDPERVMAFLKAQAPRLKE